MTNAELETLNKYKINENCIIENEDNSIYKYTYIDMNGLLIIDLYDINEQLFEFMKIEKLIQKRKNFIKSALDNKDFSKILFLMDKPYRLHMYMTIFNIIPDEQKYKLFIDVYTSAEYGFDSIGKRFINKVLKYRPHKTFENLPNEIIIYRGEGKKSTKKEKSYSWTTSIETAKWFANRFGDNGRVYRAKVDRDDIIDYLDCREENEILVKFEYLYEVEEI